MSLLTNVNKKNKVCQSKSRIKMYLYECCTEIVCSLGIGNCVEFDINYVSLLQYYRHYVLGFPMIFCVEEPLNLLATLVWLGSVIEQNMCVFARVSAFRR